jgi:hypothetical protein
MSENPPMPHGAPPTIAECVRLGLASARATIGPAIALQVFAGSLVASWYLSEDLRALLEGFTAWRTASGAYGAFLTTALCGGLVPWVYLHFRPGNRSHPGVKEGLFLTVFWGVRGVDVEFFYRFQAWLWGGGNDPATILAKVLVDQFVICTIWAVPITAIAYHFKDSGFKAAAVVQDFGRGWYRRRVLPMLVSNLGTWVPACALIFTLPLPLQLPLFNLVLCFFTILLAHLSQSQEQRKP